MSSFQCKIVQCVSQKHGTNDEQNICKFPRNNRISKIQPFSLSNAQNIPWKWDAEFLIFFFRKIKRNDDDDDDGDDVVQSSRECWRRFYISKQPKKVA